MLRVNRKNIVTFDCTLTTFEEVDTVNILACLNGETQHGELREGDKARAADFTPSLVTDLLLLLRSLQSKLTYF